MPMADGSEPACHCIGNDVIPKHTANFCFWQILGKSNPALPHNMTTVPQAQAQAQTER